MAHDEVQQQLAQTRPARDGVGFGGQPAAAVAPSTRSSRAQRRASRAACPGGRVVEMPAADTSTSRSTRCGNAIASSARDEATHRVADDRRRVDPQLAQQAVEQPRVAGDRDLLGGHRRVPEPGQVERHHAMLAREHRQLLEPVGPAARQPVDEHQRLARSGVRAAGHASGPSSIVFTGCAVDDHPPLVRCASRRPASASARPARTARLPGTSVARPACPWLALIGAHCSHRSTPAAQRTPIRPLAALSARRPA